MPFFLDGGRDHWMRTASSISILFGRFDALLGRRFGGFGGLLGIALGLLWQQHRVDVGQHFKAEGMWDLLMLQDEVDNTETSDIFAHLSEEINTRAETHAGAEKNDNGRRRNVVSQPEVLVRLMCSFLQEKGGSADSVSITEYFKNRVRSEDLAVQESVEGVCCFGEQA